MIFAQHNVLVCDLPIVVALLTRGVHVPLEVMVGLPTCTSLTEPTMLRAHAAGLGAAPAAAGLAGAAAAAS